MKEGKIYRPIEDMREKFVRENGNNQLMLDTIDYCGGSFTVLNITDEDGKFVSKVRMANGDIYDSEGSGSDYFEISYTEFYAFEEVTSGISSEGGVISMKLEVTKDNFEEMIRLIENNFKK